MFAVDEALLARARELIDSGALPSTTYATTFGGPSGGSTCDLCGQSIRPGMAEIGINWVRHGQKDRALRMHPHCFVAWSVEAGGGGAP